MKTPFYGESGGQVGDRGRVIWGDEFEGEVIDVQKPVADLIVAHIRPVRGSIQVGKAYDQEVAVERRSFTARNHTATHLLHWALREVLGDHVKQAGSLVTPELLRFDFSHFQAMTEAELTQVENLINDKLWSAEPVVKQEMTKDVAIAEGAMAIFGEKYGDQVRVVRVGSFSTELCGGTHVGNSSEIHLFKISNESGIAAGVRRIVASTSKGAFLSMRERETELNAIRDRLKATSTAEILGKVEKLVSSERDLRKQLEQLQAKSAGGEADELLSHSEALGPIRWVSGICAADSTGMKRLRDLADRIKSKAPDAFVVLGVADPDGSKASVLVTLGSKVAGGLDANELIQVVAPCILGRGGGKKDLAQAGGTNPEGLPQVLIEARKWISTKLKLG